MSQPEQQQPALDMPPRPICWALSACFALMVAQFLFGWHRGDVDWLDAANLCIALVAVVMWGRDPTDGKRALMYVALFWLLNR